LVKLEQINSEFNMVIRNLVWLSAGLFLAGCVTARSPEPSPSFAVMPAKGKSYEAFQNDDRVCQQSAQNSVNNQSPQENAAQATVNGAVAGTAVGAASGALIGAASNQSGQGAALGAGLGLIAGTMVGSASGSRDARAIQGRYDIVYAQCMKAKGNEVVASEIADPVIIRERRPIYVYPDPYWCCGPYYRRRW
jgi:uncharacterized protein YcfJ